MRWPWNQESPEMDEDTDRIELRSAIEELREIGREMKETQIRLEETANRLEESTVA